MHAEFQFVVRLVGGPIDVQHDSKTILAVSLSVKASFAYDLVEGRAKYIEPDAGLFGAAFQQHTAQRNAIVAGNQLLIRPIQRGLGAILNDRPDKDAVASLVAQGPIDAKTLKREGRANLAFLKMVTQNRRHRNIEIAFANLQHPTQFTH